MHSSYRPILHGSHPPSFDLNDWCLGRSVAGTQTSKATERRSQGARSHRLSAVKYSTPLPVGPTARLAGHHDGPHEPSTGNRRVVDTAGSNQTATSRQHTTKAEQASGSTVALDYCSIITTDSLDSSSHHPTPARRAFSIALEETTERRISR